MPIAASSAARGKCAADAGVEPRARQHRRRFACRVRARRKLAAIGRPTPLPRASLRPSRSTGPRLHDHHRVRIGELQVRGVELRVHRRPPPLFVSHVADDADHFDRVLGIGEWPGRRAEPDALADRVLAGPETARCRLADDGDGWCPGRSAGVKPRPAIREYRALEIVGRDVVAADDRRAADRRAGRRRTRSSATRRKRRRAIDRGGTTPGSARCV